MFRLGTGALYASSWTRGPRFARPARVRPPLKRPIPLEEFIMRPWMDRAMLRGRIHGRLMLVLVAVVVLVSAAAVWQFSALRDDRGPDLADIEGRETLTDPGPTGEPDSLAASSSTSPSPTASPSATAEEEAAGADASTAAAATSDAAVTGPQCTASLTLDSADENSVSVTVTVANTGAEAVSGWEITLGLRHLTVTTTWGLNHVEGDVYGDILFNGALDPGASTAPSFQADIGGDYAIPATVPCVPTG